MQFTTTFILLSLLWLKANCGLLSNNVKEIHANTSAMRGKHQDVAKRITDEPTIPHNETCTNPFEEFVSPVRGSPRCCRKCEAGTGMLRLCSDLEDTQCTPCEPPFEFSPIPSATLKCQQCRKCQDLHPFAKTRIACTPTKDTECDCMKNYYMSVENQTCKPCTVCKPNEGMVKPCEWNTDTQCQACPSGFWSALIGDAVKCIPCQTCSDDQILVRECLVNTDTICCPKFNTNCSASGISSFVTEHSGLDKRENWGLRVSDDRQIDWCPLVFPFERNLLFQQLPIRQTWIKSDEIHHFVF
ncbi:Tumor necrosis factor receptor superfamily member 16 [Paragonimus heterotremus]|uniref:Tumor necrosis factor receptor superfamily member 16 n=1 Tax=Paragonimus heterotremus TaxID=100268 RepID=A0A8J4SNG6_9TREM|nr:Tumor necrosis factor receptor superfamily member 16 [Paragonimus heterotremus]